MFSITQEIKQITNKLLSRFFEWVCASNFQNIFTTIYQTLF